MSRRVPDKTAPDGSCILTPQFVRLSKEELLNKFFYIGRASLLYKYREFDSNVCM